MEPFPTSVHKVHICVIATTTKICTSVHSTQGYPEGFLANTTPSYTLIRIWLRINGLVSVSRFSAIHFQG